MDTSNPKCLYCGQYFHKTHFLIHPCIIQKKCYICGNKLNFNELFERNEKEYHIDYLQNLWSIPVLELLCCNCHDRYEAFNKTKSPRALKELHDYLIEKIGLYKADQIIERLYRAGIISDSHMKYLGYLTLESEE